MSQSEDMDAINRYMRTTPLVTPEAFQIKDAFIRWWDNLNFLDRTLSQAAYDEARTRRNQLNIANQKTERDKAEMKEVIARGSSTEEYQGGKAPPIDKATGRVGTQVSKPTVAPTPSTMPDKNTPTVGKTRAKLQLGSRGEDVHEWQKFLGISPTTGYFGEVTVAKTKNYQKSNGLKDDGIVGPMTWAKAFPGAAAEPMVPEAVAFAPAPAPSPPLGNSPTKKVNPPPKPPAPKPPAQKPPTATASNKPPTSTFKPPPNQKPPAANNQTAVASATTKAKDKTKKAVAKVSHAGIFDVSGWPLWGKVAAVVTIAGGIIGAAMGKHKNAPRLFMGKDEH